VTYVEKAFVMENFFINNTKLLKKPNCFSESIGKAVKKPVWLLWPATVGKTICFKRLSKKISFSHPGHCALGVILFQAIAFVDRPDVVIILIKLVS
jgi:hypothetical protein